MSQRDFNLNFGRALDALRWGRRVARSGWNGKGMWLMLVDPEMPFARVMFRTPISEIVNSPAGPLEDKSHAFRLHPWIGMKTATGEMVPWTASQTDILATDWETL